MANLEKHKKNFAQEWLDPEESTVPAQSRSSHVLGAYIKIPKAAARKRGRVAPALQGAPKPDVALVREPAPPARTDVKHTQPSSPDHLRKLDRLAKLRAPYSPKPSTGAH